MTPNDGMKSCMAWGICSAGGALQCCTVCPLPGQKWGKY